MKKAVLYARVSSSLQEKERTIESQIEELKRQIKKDGNALVKEYIDDGYSGAMLSRPGMDELREDIKDKFFDVIYFHNADRIARDVTYQNIIIGEILRRKKQIIINGQDYVHNPENKFTLTVLGAVAELEKTKILKRSMRGRQHKLRQGYLMGCGYNLYGYKYNRRTAKLPAYYEVIPEEAKIVKYVFELYSQGDVGYKDIVRHLKERNIPPRKGRQWNWHQIRMMLRNITYTGIRYFNTTTDNNALNRFEGRTKTIHRVPTDRSTWIGIKIPQIIDQELFDQAQERIKYNVECFRKSQETKLMAGLVYCGQCGERCYGYHRHYCVKRKGQLETYRRTVYKCRIKEKSHNPEINARILEPGIFNMIETYLLNPDKLKGCMDYFRKSHKTNQAEIEKQVRDIKGEINNIQKQKQRIVDLYASDELEQETYVKKVNAYDDNTAKLTKQMNSLVGQIPVFSKPEEVKKELARYSGQAKEDFKKCIDIKTKRRFLLDYIDKIEYLYNYGIDEISIYGKVPIKLIDGTSKLSFILKDKINRVEKLAKLREKDARDGLSGSVYITSKKYNKLKTNK